MRKPNRVFALIAAALAAAAAPLWAQPNRTWVANSGVDGNPCTPTQPCATFATAISKAGANGFVSCVNAGSYGASAIVISSPVTIDCTGTGGTILGAVSAIDINPPPNSPNFAVVLRGLDIGSTGAAGFSGIRFIEDGGSLTIEDSVIRNFAGGSGVRFAPTLAARLNIVNTTISANGDPNTGFGAGILIDPDNAGYANVTLEDVRLIGNAEAGLLVNVTGNTGSSTNVLATRSSFVAGRNGIRVIAPAGTAGASVVARDSIVNGNTINGLLADGPAASIIVATTAISGNSTGVASANGGIVGSYGNNNLIRNGVNGAFNGFVTEN